MRIAPKTPHPSPINADAQDDADVGESPPPQEIKWAPVESLEFDPENPRLPASVDRSDPSAVLRWMLEDASTLELMGSIGAQGYFAGEPLLTVRRNGSWIVVEGNRRVAAVKLLLHPEEAPSRRRAVAQVVDASKSRPRNLPIPSSITATKFWTISATGTSRA